MTEHEHAQPYVVHESDCPVEDWSAKGRHGMTWRTLLSADRTPTHSLTIGVAEIEPGAPDDLHLHRHEPAEAYYILAGTGVVSIDGVLHDVRSGSTVFVPSDAVHAVGNTAPTCSDCCTCSESIRSTTSRTSSRADRSAVAEHEHELGRVRRRP